MSNFSNNSPDKPLLVLIDGHSLAFRSYYAFLHSRKGALRTSDGIPTSICFGFLNSLLQVIESEKPNYLTIAFDLAEPTFRHKADPQYKANREETPDDFISDMSNLRILLDALNISTATVSGYEADDILGTLAEKGVEEGYQVKILSGDRDLFQLVDDGRNISILYLDPKAFKKGGQNFVEFDRSSVIEKLKVSPEQVVDYKALCGDKSDNIPGVKGIGDKTAIKLLNEYENLDEIYNNLDKIKGAVNKKLVSNKDNAIKSQFLAKIVTDVPVDVNLADCRLRGFEIEDVINLFKKLELKKLRNKIEEIYRQLGGTLELKVKKDKGDNIQLSLFDTLEKPAPKVEETIVIKKDISGDINPQIIDTEDKLNELIKILERETNIDNPVAWDTETTTLEPWNAELVGIGCCWGNKATDMAYIPISHKEGTQIEKEIILNKLRSILEGKEYPKSFQNTKFDRLVLHYQGINLAGVSFDTMLASYVINPETTHNLTDLSERYELKVVAKSYKELAIPKNQTIANLDINTVAEYCAIDCYATYHLTQRLKIKLKERPLLDKLLQEIEIPLEAVLSDMEITGISLNREYLNTFSQQLGQTLQELENQVYQEAGETFNLNSPKQLSVVLFENLELDTRKTRKTKTGYSTNQTVLEKLKGDHPIINNILEYRTLAKLKSTYVDTLPALVRKDSDRVHTSFNQAVTATGRLSSSNPNLQNIPIRTEFSRQIRQAFIPRKDWLLVAADYSQIELRILAHLSQEPVLVDAYKNNLDVHRVTAQLLFDREEITSEERRLGKIINFGVIYGMGANRFSRESGMKTNIGKDFIDKYREKYSHVFNYLEGVKAEAITQGYVTTILGRRRYFNFTSFSLQKLRGQNKDSVDLNNIKYDYQDMQLLRAAANATIQGSSADIIKIAMIKLNDILKNYRAKLLLQVHDELVLEVPQDEWSELQGIIKNTMEQAVNLTVPLIVEINKGKNWMEAK